MRFIFVDEAGTSDAERENARIVAGVIVHADREIVKAETALREALSSVPLEFRDGFAFHAEEIMNSPKYRDRWRLTDRVNLLKSVMRIPNRLCLPVAFGQVWKGRLDDLDHVGMKNSEFDHMSAFTQCVAQADRYIREFGDPDEIGTMVVEKNDVQKWLKNVPSALRRHPMVLAPDGLHMRRSDEEQGYNSQDGVLKVTRIRDSVHFVGKSDDPLVWIADAIAYGLKRCFNQHEFGEDFRQAIGVPIDLYDYRGPVSGQLFFSYDVPRGRPY